MQNKSFPSHLICSDYPNDEEETRALSIRDVPRITVDADLLTERTRPSGDRHEYLDGLGYAMAGASEAHGTICMNLAAALVTQLRGGPCRACRKDMRVRCGTH